MAPRISDGHVPMTSCDPNRSRLSRLSCPDILMAGCRKLRTRDSHEEIPGICWRVLVVYIISVKYDY